MVLVHSCHTIGFCASTDKWMLKNVISSVILGSWFPRSSSNNLVCASWNLSLEQTSVNCCWVVRKSNELSGCCNPGGFLTLICV